MKQKNVLLSLFSLSFLSIGAMELATVPHNFKEIKTTYAKPDAGSLKLFHDGTAFFVKDGEACTKVPNYFLDDTLKKIKPSQLEKFQKHGFIDIKRLSNNEYKLNSQVRGLGGGPWLCWFAYEGTKVVGYAAYGAAVVYTGGAAITEAPLAIEAIETAAIAAGVVGAMVPGA